MAYQNIAFCWYGVISTDVDASKAFLSEVLGWGVETMTMGDEEATMFTVGGIPRMHLRGPQMGEPSCINNYLRVEDVDASSAAAVANGGQQLVPPTDIPPGRFSVVASPSGAVFSLFKEADPTAENAPGGVGAVHWVELHSRDVPADVAWLTSTFGFGTEDMPTPNFTYTILTGEDGPRGGAMPAMHPEGPSMWLTWIQVENVDETAARATQHGGKVLGEPMDMDGVGRMVMVADPAGVHFGIITPAPRG